MKFIGITGGVGAGKSAILGYIAEHYNAKVMLADEIAHDLMMPGTKCYDTINFILFCLVPVLSCVGVDLKFY